LTTYRHCFVYIDGLTYSVRPEMIPSSICLWWTYR